MPQAILRNVGMGKHCSVELGLHCSYVPGCAAVLQPQHGLSLCGTELNTISAIIINQTSALHYKHGAAVRLSSSDRPPPLLYPLL